MSDVKFYLIAGATGRQGGATVDGLLSHEELEIRPHQIYAISRQPDGPGAARLKAKYEGINVIGGDLSQPEAILGSLPAEALPRTAVFLAQAHGPTELADAKGFIDASTAAGVRRFVYSSVDRGGRKISDEDPSDCKTFSDKFYIEKHLKNVCNTATMEYTILRPTWFAENAWWGFPGRLCMSGWKENMNGKKLQVIVAKDLGRWAAEALLRPEHFELRNEAVSISSQELSFNDVDDIFKRHTGHGVPLTYGFLARFLIWMVKDLRTMFGFIGRRDYGANLSWLHARVKPTTFEEWVQAEVPARQ